jgi:hypothetical protein
MIWSSRERGPDLYLGRDLILRHRFGVLYERQVDILAVAWDVISADNGKDN